MFWQNQGVFQNLQQSALYHIVYQWIMKIHIVINKTVKKQFCPSFVPQTFEGLIFFVPFMSLGHFGGQKRPFSKHKRQEYKNLQRKNRWNLIQFYWCICIWYIVFLYKSLSPDNILWKCCPISFRDTHNIIVLDMFKSYF